MSDPHLLLSGYALDALDSDDRALFEAHLTDCEDCRRELAEFGPAVTELSTLTTAAPPPELRQNVLSAITGVRQLGPSASASSSGPSRPADGTLSDFAGDSRFGRSNPARIGRLDRGRILRTLTAMAAAVAVLAAVALGAWSYGRSQVAQRYGADRAAVARIIGAPDARMYRQQAPNGMHITYVVSKQRNAALAVVENSTTPGNGRTYQLWTVRTEHGKPDFIPDRTFINPTGPIILSTDIRAAAALGITVEPSGGSPKPTTDPFAVQPV